MSVEVLLALFFIGLSVVLFVILLRKKSPSGRIDSHSMEPAAHRSERRESRLPTSKLPMEEIKAQIHINSHEPGKEVNFRYVSTTNLFEIRTGIQVANHGSAPVTIHRIVWDVWIAGLHVKSGEFIEKFELTPKSCMEDIQLREVLRESETADVAWANQETGKSCYLDGMIFGESQGQKFTKKFSLLNLNYEVAKEVSRIKSSDLIREAYLDSLTGLLQRKFLEDNLQTMINRNVHRDPISFAMIDIDDFKNVNDTHGHLVGDDVLMAVSAHIKGITGERGVCIRYGGDEFCVILENCPTADAKVLAENIRAAVENSVMKVKEERVLFTVSVGIATLLEKANYKTLIRHADEMLKVSKQSGKNKVSASNRRIPAE